jgi:hypothetical protein
LGDHFDQFDQFGGEVLLPSSWIIEGLYQQLRVGVMIWLINYWIQVLLSNADVFSVEGFLIY